ncbi:MAG TPA: hypothetical protein PKN73_03055, partial [Candidatus Paceibacterota bacterium]|nr:hypothetical protein [Candidatus Paceibacterota bacterium]
NMLTSVHELVQRFWFLRRGSKKGVCQRLAHLSQYVNARSQIGAKILVFAKANQNGRAPTFGAIAPIC